MSKYYNPNRKRNIYNPNSNELIPYVRVKFDKLINPDIRGVKMLFREELEDKNFQPMHWSTQMSGVQIPDDVADHLEQAWKQYK